MRPMNPSCVLVMRGSGGGGWGLLGVELAVSHRIEAACHRLTALDASSRHDVLLHRVRIRSGDVVPNEPTGCFVGP
jgi:hypothetical protein